MTIPLPTLPQPDAYEYLIANVWRTETHFNGVKANDHRCLYSTDKVHAHAAAVSAAKDAEIAKLKTVMVAAAEEIQAYWDAHCDADGYGPVNLMRRLEEGIPSQYGYTAGAFEQLRADNIRLQNEVVGPLRERVKVLEDALRYAVKQAPELATVPGIRDTLEQKP